VSVSKSSAALYAAFLHNVALSDVSYLHYHLSLYLHTYLYICSERFEVLGSAVRSLSAALRQPVGRAELRPTGRSLRLRGHGGEVRAGDAADSKERVLAVVWWMTVGCITLALCCLCYR
jgi:hypothetical protein